MIEAYQKALWDIYAAIGCDTDSMDGPGAIIAGMGEQGFIDLVVREAKEFRAEYDELLEELK